MRKLYAFLAGFIIYMAGISLNAQPNPESCTADFEKLNVSANPLHATFRAIPWHSADNRPVRICWQFGDGTDTCIQYSNTHPGPYLVNHVYPAAGQYQVCVRITYAGGCMADKCRTIQIGSPDLCTADFVKLNFSPTNHPWTAVYKALPWNNHNRKPRRICWDFGDGTDTCINYSNLYIGQYTVTHSYNQPGNYEVCVKIFYNGGCEARKCKHIQIGRPDSCRADFEKIPGTVNNQLQAYYRALPWHNNNKKPRRICWDFGDGRDTCINYPENYNGQYIVGHRYDHPGIYEVCIKIFYYGGCEARKCKPIRIVQPDECTADFERLLTSANQLTVGFRALPWNNHNRKPQRICWDFGDGEDTCISYPENYTGQYTVMHRYDHPGNYEVCVKIFYYGSCEARKCKPVVIPAFQVCSVNILQIIPSVNSFTRGFFASVSSHPTRRPVRICWDFGDGEDTCIIIPQTVTNYLPYLFIRHNYPGPGAYRACVTVRFQEGCEARDCEEVFIRSSSSVCGGFMTDSLIAPRTYRFKAFSIHNRNDEVVSYLWTFGDGSTASGREVTHTYNQPGEYEVCLRMRTRLGCETRICKPLRVPAATHNAILQLSPNPVVNILNVSFFSSNTEAVNIKIMNGNGVMVRNYTRNVTAGANNWTHDLTALIPGAYSYVVQSPNQLASAIFLKL